MPIEGVVGDVFCDQRFMCLEHFMKARTHFSCDSECYVQQLPEAAVVSRRALDMTQSRGGFIRSPGINFIRVGTLGQIDVDDHRIGRTEFLTM